MLCHPQIAFHHHGPESDLTRFLTGPAATFTKKIRLRRANRLSVFLIGSTGAAIRIAVHEGVPYTDTVAIVVVDTATIDALLQQKWADTKTKLSAQNVEGATQHFEYSKQSLYAELFSVLIDKLPQIVDDMQAIALISITDRAAKYRIRRLETHNTGTHSITHYICFIMDEKGIWKILRF